MKLNIIFISLTLFSIISQPSEAFVEKTHILKTYKRETIEKKLLIPRHSDAITSTSKYGAPFGLDFLGSNINEDRQKKPKELIAKIDTVESIDDFLKVISEDERLCIVKFRASWCKSCQKFDVHFKKLANEVADKIEPSNPNVVVEKGEVKMIDVEYTANKKLCKTLGIKKLPYIHMYKGSKGRVCDFLCNSKNFNVLIEKMEKHLYENDQNLDKKMEEEKFFESLEKGAQFMNSTLEMDFNDTSEQAEQKEK